LINRVINYARHHKFAVSLANLIHTKFVIEEFGSEHDKRVLMTLDVGQVEHDVGSLGDHGFGPGSGLETVDWLPVPDELTLAGLGVRASSQVILAAVTINVHPGAHVVEVPGFVCRNLVKGFLRMEISL